jgi:hypothetical protein
MEIILNKTKELISLCNPLWFEVFCIQQYHRLQSYSYIFSLIPCLSCLQNTENLKFTYNKLRSLDAYFSKFIE